MCARFFANFQFVDPPAKWNFDSIFRQFVTYFVFILYFISDHILYLIWMLDSYLFRVSTQIWLIAF